MKNKILKNLNFYITFFKNKQNERCECQPGWEGYNCEIDVNECASNPCRNGGICKDKNASFECECIKGFKGKNKKKRKLP